MSDKICGALVDREMASFKTLQCRKNSMDQRKSLTHSHEVSDTIWYLLSGKWKFFCILIRLKILISETFNLLSCGFYKVIISFTIIFWPWCAKSAGSWHKIKTELVNHSDPSLLFLISACGASRGTNSSSHARGQCCGLAAREVNFAIL